MNITVINTDDLDRLKQAADRYETVRRMSVQQFKDAWQLNLQTGKPFDEIIDNLKPFIRPTATTNKEPR